MTVPFSSAFAVAFVLALVRASAWVVICPPFANKSIPAMAKIGIALGIAVDAAVTLQHDTLPSTNSQILTQVLVQAAIGFVLGFVISLFVTAVVAAGSLIDLFSGLNLPQALDPLSLQQTPIIGQFYNLVATALLFTTGSVLVIVDGFLRSFKAVGTTLPSSYCKINGDPNSDSVTFYDGHGFGHGVGMCQWCAEARAAEGQNFEQILVDAYPQAKMIRAY